MHRLLPLSYLGSGVSLSSQTPGCEDHLHTDSQMPYGTAPEAVGQGFVRCAPVSPRAADTRSVHVVPGCGDDGRSLRHRLWDRRRSAGPLVWDAPSKTVVMICGTYIKTNINELK